MRNEIKMRLKTKTDMESEMKSKIFKCKAFSISLVSHAWRYRNRPDVLFGLHLSSAFTVLIFMKSSHRWSCIS